MEMFYLTARKSCLSGNFRNHIKSFFLSLAVMVLVSGMLSSVAVAEVSQISISPEDPSPGDVVTVTGKASPNEVISASVSFEKKQPVSGGIFTYFLSGVTIPEGSDSFGLVATGVDDLKIEVRLPVLGYVSVPGNLISTNGNIASFGTGKIKSGTYDIRLSGGSREDKVTLSFTARASITADADGNFVYTYNTGNMPEGDYSINIGGKPLQLDLGNTEDDSSTSLPSTGKSSKKSSVTSTRTGTDLKIVDAEGVGEENTDNDPDTVESSTSVVSNNDIEDVPDNYVEGFELSPEPSGMDRLPDLGLMGLLVGIVSIAAILIGYRKNRYR